MDTIKEDDPRTRPIAVGQETLIEIDRGSSGLGLSVVGGSDTQLVRSFSSSINYMNLFVIIFSQELLFMISMMVVLLNVMVVYLVGDQILEVNNIDLRSATHEQAIQALRQAATIVRILVLRGKMLTEMMNEQDKFDIITIELIKKSGKGLGKNLNQEND